jgi:hypothetical protein
METLLIMSQVELSARISDPAAVFGDHVPARLFGKSLN